MKRQPFCNFLLANISLTEFGLKIPAPFVSLILNNSELDSMTSWELNCSLSGDDTNNINIAAMEALLYSAAQSTSNVAGVPVTFMFGWLDANGQVDTYLSYQGFTLQFSVNSDGQYMHYKLIGYASIALQTQMPVLQIPAVEGIVQPSAVVEALAKAVRADLYYDLDIDHTDAPTLISHGTITTSFNAYVGGNFNGEDDYETFPGLLPLSKSYNANRDSAGLDTTKARKLSTVINNVTVHSVKDFLKRANCDTSPQLASFSYWVEEPTMTSKGVIHYKSDSSIASNFVSGVLEYGTANGNILSLQGNYDGVAYNMTDMSFASLGFAIDGGGDTIVQSSEVVNSWSSSLADVYQTASIINDINALASQFSGKVTVTIIGNPRQFRVAEPVSLVVMSNNTLSPISGVYSIMSVSHQISVTYLTVLTLQRLVMSSANQVATSQGITIRGSAAYPVSSYETTDNVLSTGKVDFGTLYPTFQDLMRMQ